MSWSATARRVRDASRPMGQRVQSLHSLIANHHAPLGFQGTREALRSRVGVTGQRWRAEQVLRALEHLETSRAAHLNEVEEVAARRRVEKSAGRRVPRAADVEVLEHPRWQPGPVIVDVAAVLRRVVDEVFGADVQRQFPPPVRHVHQVVVTSADGERHAGVEASSTGWFGVYAFDDLDVATFTIEYDEVEAEQADACRRMALIALAYLAGSFQVRERHTLFRRRVQPLVDVEVDGQTWTLRRAAFSV